MIEASALQLEVQATARRLAADLLGPQAAAVDASEGFPADNLRALARVGLFGVSLDPRFGGLGAGAVGYALAVRELAAGCAATTVVTMVANMVGEAISLWGDEAQKAHFLPRLTSGEWASAGFSLSEPGSGSAAASLTAKAVRDGDDYVLDGSKAWVTGGGHAGVYLVMARTDVPPGSASQPPGAALKAVPNEKSKGISAFLVEAGTPGLTAGKPEDKLGLRASSTTQLILEGCRVPAHNRLGPEGIGFRIAMTALDGGRIGVSAQACGIATAAQEVATRFARQHPNDVEARQRVAESEAELRAGFGLVLHAASLKDQKKPHTREAAMAKLYCTEMAGRVCQRTLRMLGLEGQGRATPVERLARDARITRIYEGTNEVQRIVIARELLSSRAT